MSKQKTDNIAILLVILSIFAYVWWHYHSVNLTELLSAAFVLWLGLTVWFLRTLWRYE